MRLVIDVTRQARRFLKKRLPTGIDRVALAYINQYGKQAHALLRFCGRAWILPLAQSTAMFAWLSKPRQQREYWLILIKGILLSCLQTLPNELCLLAISQTGAKQQRDHARLKAQKNLKLIYFIHDLIPLTYPEFCSAGEDIRHAAKIKHALSMAAGILTNSADTLAELSRYAASVQQTMPKATVARLAGVEVRPKVANLMPNKPYFVVLGTIEPRKNHWLLLQVWRQLQLEYREHTPTLLIVGQKGWECDHVLRYIQQCRSLQEIVLLKTNCNDNDLNAYLQHCQALLFPSFAEGYGLPLIEALSQGVPVIASDLSVFREIAGELIEYVAPIDGQGWLALIMAYAEPQSVARAAQCARIKTFQAPTWQHHFARVDSFLQHLDAG